MADAFIAHADQVREVSEGQREQYRIKWNLLTPHFDGVKVSEVDTRFLLALREKLSRPGCLTPQGDRSSVLFNELRGYGA